MYRTRVFTVEAVCYDGANTAEITAFTGEENTSHNGWGLQVRGSDGRWTDMHPGWWVSKDANGMHCTYSGAAFSRHFEEGLPQEGPENAEADR